jgi:hypothetical protein
MREAYRLAQLNNVAPGVDGVTFEAIEAAGLEGWLQQLGAELVRRSYRPTPIRRVARLRAAVPLILEDQINGLTGLMREPVAEMTERLRGLDEQIRRHDQRIARFCQADERCRRLVEGESVGPRMATALVAAIGNARHFKTGRVERVARHWCPVNIVAASELCCSESVSAEIGTCARFSFTVLARRPIELRANVMRAACG